MLTAEPAFGYKPRVSLKSQRLDCTEVDLRLGGLLIEAKLTEYDFQRATPEGSVALTGRNRAIDRLGR